MAMLLAAVIALIVANTAAHEGFLEFFHMEVVLGVGPLVGEMSLAHIINDIFMAIFFLLVGLEIKYEMTVGELTNIRQAALPPIVIYSIFNGMNPETSHGWGVPTATDIAFALGIMALLGDHVPNGIRVFLSTLAVADDIIAILVIAIFYGQSPSVFWLVMTALVMVVLVLMNRAHVYSLAPYLLVGILLWFCVFSSGVHSTIAGVLLAFTIPSGSRVNLRTFLKWSGERVQQAAGQFDANTPIMAQDDYMKTVKHLSKVANEVIPPATRLEHALYPWVYFGVLPLFALTNADVALVCNDIMTMLSSPVLYGVFFGLLLGKPIGIVLFSWLTVKFKIADLPSHCNWMHMLGAGILGGVGFTMAIFVANLAFPDPVLVADAKLGILSASLVAGIVGFIFLYIQAERAKKQGLSFGEAKDMIDPQSEAPFRESAEADEEIQEEAEAAEAADVEGISK